MFHTYGIKAIKTIIQYIFFKSARDDDKISAKPLPIICKYLCLSHTVEPYVFYVNDQELIAYIRYVLHILVSMDV